MNQLRLEADESSAKVEELQKSVKVLEQENLQKEHEITSLQHKNNALEAEVEKLETQIKDANGRGRYPTCYSKRDIATKTTAPRGGG